jgi:hypothetical protein
MWIRRWRSRASDPRLEGRIRPEVAGRFDAAPTASDTGGPGRRHQEARATGLRRRAGGGGLRRVDPRSAAGGWRGPGFAAGGGQAVQSLGSAAARGGEAVKSEVGGGPRRAAARRCSLGSAATRGGRRPGGEIWARRRPAAGGGQAGTPGLGGGPRRAAVRKCGSTPAAGRCPMLPRFDTSGGRRPRPNGPPGARRRRNHHGLAPRDLPSPPRAGQVA